MIPKILHVVLSGLSVNHRIFVEVLKKVFARLRNISVLRDFSFRRLWWTCHGNVRGITKGLIPEILLYLWEERLSHWFPFAFLSSFFALWLKLKFIRAKVITLFYFELCSQTELKNFPVTTCVGNSYSNIAWLLFLKWIKNTIKLK